MNKELKKMSRAEILEILISQIEENERLSAEVALLKEQLENQMLDIEQSGTLAEAAMRLNGVFRAADEAARQYLYNVKQKAGITAVCEPLLSAEEKSAVPVVVEALKTSNNEKQIIIEDAKKEAQRIIDEANEKSAKIISEADAYWKNTIKKAKVMLGG